MSNLLLFGHSHYSDETIFSFIDDIISNCFFKITKVNAIWL